MSFGLPPVKHRSELPPSFEVKEHSYGLPSAISGGLNTARQQIAPRHPLEKSLRSFQDDKVKLNNSVMMFAQGPAGPLIHAMEIRAAKQIGRHPFLPSSNFQLDVLTGRDMEIDFEDFLNPEEFKEVHAHPHVVMENLHPKAF